MGFFKKKNGQAADKATTKQKRGKSAGEIKNDDKNEAGENIEGEEIIEETPVDQQNENAKESDTK